MNITHAEHTIYALLMQLAVGLTTGNWLAGAMLAVGFFVAREHAQVEKHLPVSERLYGFKAFDLRLWSRDALLDAACPIVAVGIVTVIMEVWV